MSDSPLGPAAEPLGEPLGAGEAIGMGWRMMTADFGRLFLAGLILEAILTGMFLIPCINALAAVAAIFVYPPLWAGLFLVVRQRIDGNETTSPGWVFHGFRYRYWDSVLAALPITLTGLGLSILFFVLQLGGQFTMAALMGQSGPGPAGLAGPPPPLELFGTMGALYGMIILLQAARLLIKGAVALFFVLGLAVIWEYPRQGWESAKHAASLVRENLGQALVVGLAFAGLYAVASLGWLFCCLGEFATYAIFDVWFAATMLFLYRSWSNQPLEQEPLTYEELTLVEDYGEEPWPPEQGGYGPESGPPPEGEGQGPSRTPPGPVPPSDIHPPDRS